MNRTRIVAIVGAMRIVPRRWNVVTVWVVAILLIIAGQASAVLPTYNIVPLGLADFEHTRNDGYKYTFADDLNEAGQVSGVSYRYEGGSTQLGYSAWLYDVGATNHIGLVDDEHSRTDGYKYSVPEKLTQAGQVLGYSYRYNGGSTQLGQSIWLYDGTDTIGIGLVDSEHTFNGYEGFNGYKFSDAFELNEAGQVIGQSRLFIDDPSVVGYSAWLYNGAATLNVGLTGSEHTRSDGNKVSYPHGLNEQGQVVGISQRYNGGSTSLGYSAWLYDGTTTVDIGLTGAEYTANNGNKYSFVTDLNEAGKISGHSSVFNGGSVSTALGTIAWLYNNGTRIEIGLVDGEHTNSSGYQRNIVEQLNEAGQVYGYSDRYNGGSTEMGRSVWLYDGATTVHVGLTGSEHTRNDGYENDTVSVLNEAGKVLGYSDRYNGGSTEMGRSVWLYDGATTVHLGLTGAEHTKNDGYKVSSAGQLNEAGQVFGSSERYNSGGTALGQSAWLYNGTTTINIGLAGPEHTRNDGYKVSFAVDLNESGQVIGESDRFNGGSTAKGRSIWFYNGTTTHNIGLAGAEHTRIDGYKYSFVTDLNEAGQVIGRSYRYNGGSGPGPLFGWDAWLYDPVLDHTFSLTTSTRSDGLAYSSVNYLGEDGLVLGTHTLYDAQGNSVPSAFYFTITSGIHDLGPLIAGGLPAKGWEYLATAIRTNNRGQILGYGKLTIQADGQMAYLLTPVPEPSSILLLSTASFALTWRGVRRSKHV